MNAPFGLTTTLVGAAVVCGTLAYLLFVRGRLPVPVGLAVVLLKFALPVVYFAWIFDGTWTFIDDYTYLRVSRELLVEGLTPVSVFADPVNLLRLDSWSGVQFGYGWWNMLAQYLIGPHYYAPVLMNVALSCGSAAALYALAREAEYPRGYAQALMLFFMVHWEVLSWSSVLNMKDVLIFTLAPAALLLAVRMRRRFTIVRLLLLLAIAGIFLVIRPYSIVLLGGAVVASSAMGGGADSRRRLLRLVGTSLVAGLLILPFVRPLVALAIYAFTTQVDVSPARLLYNAVWFLLTPQPWSIADDHGFLRIAAVLHLVFLPFAAVGAVLLWRRGGVPRLLLYYFLLVLALNMIAPQSVRHRLQAVFVVAWLQFHCLSVLVRAAVRGAAPPGRGLAPAAGA